jgi:hypothetical protein
MERDETIKTRLHSLFAGRVTMLMGTRRRGAYALVFEGLKGSEYSPSFKTSKGAADGVCPRGRVASGGRESFEGR